MLRPILLVDDDIAEISAVKRVLLRAGHRVTLATNSTDALAAIEETPPALVVLAPACENGDGAVFGRRLASQRATRDIPIVLLGAGDDGIAADFVPRPIDPGVLETALRAALERPPPAPDPERSAAEQEAIRELRRAEEGARDLQGEWQAVVEALRVSPEEEEIERAAAAEGARRRALATARERAARDGSRAGAPDPPEELAPELLEGTLAASSMPRLLGLAARGRASGRLEVAADPARSLWLEGGRVVGADSSAPGERAEVIALRLGLITREQHRQVAPAVAGLASRRVGALLLERSFLKPSELALLARRRAEEIAFALFESQAPYRFERGERVPADERLALERGTLALALEGIRRRWLSPRLEAVLGGPATLLSPAARAPPVADLALSAEERRVAELADGLRTLDEVLAGAPLDALSSRQVLAGLVELGVLELKNKGPAEASAPPPAGSIDLARIAEKLEQVRRADYFAILGLGRTCTRYEVREASERLLAELTAERFASSAPDLLAEVEEIRRVLEEAREILSDDGLRGEYLAGLED